MIILLQRNSGLNILLKKVEKVVEPMKVSYNKRLKNQFCCPAVKKFVNRCDSLPSGIWLDALFVSALEESGPLFRVSLICIGSNGQLYLVMSIIVFN